MEEVSDTTYNLTQFVAIALHLSRYVLALAGFVLCVLLFRTQRHVGWLVLAITFTDTFWMGLLRVVQGRPFLAYQTHGVSPDGLATLTTRMELPVTTFLSVLGLYLLLRAFRRESKRD